MRASARDYFKFFFGGIAEEPDALNFAAEHPFEYPPRIVLCVGENRVLAGFSDDEVEFHFHICWVLI